MTTYQCAQCGAVAEVKDGQVVRSCACEAPVVANLMATVYGESSTAGER